MKSDKETSCKTCGKIYPRWKLNYSQVCLKCEDESIPYSNNREKCSFSNLFFKPFIYIGETVFRILSK